MVPSLLGLDSTCNLQHYFPMTLTLAKEKVGALSPKDQGDLAVWILDQLPVHSKEDAVEESINTATERACELDSGKVKDLSHEEFVEGIPRHRGR